MNTETATVQHRLQALKRATAAEIARAGGLTLTETYQALVSLESQRLARVQVTHDHVGVGYVREWVAA